MNTALKMIALKIMWQFGSMFTTEFKAGHKAVRGTAGSQVKCIIKKRKNNKYLFIKCVCLSFFPTFLRACSSTLII